MAANLPLSARPLDGEASIAVLPFVNMSSDAESGYFADGLTEELTQKLAGIRGLKVAGRTSAFVFKGRPESPPPWPRHWESIICLRAACAAPDSQLRVTAQLLDARDGLSPLVADL